MTRRTKNPSLVHWVPCEFYFDAFRMCSLVVIVGFCYLNIIRRDYLWLIIFINISLFDWSCMQHHLRIEWVQLVLFSK
jgi:hypothetical protein